MKKTLVVISVLILAVVLSGCGKKGQEQKKDQSQEQKQSESQAPSVISSIKDAMGLGKKMKCVYQVKDGKESMESVVYVDGSEYRSEVSIAGKNRIAVFSNDALYSWGEGEKTGFKMSKSCMEEMNKNIPSQPAGQADLKAETGDKVFEDAVNVKCEPVSAVDLSVPSGVNFTDQCEMLKQSQEMLKKFQGNVPNVPPGMPK